MTRVQAEPYYPTLFRTAFGDATVTAERISKALAQFVRSLVSYRSRYDEGRAQVGSGNQPFPNFTDQENAGKQLFLDNRTGCSNCHGGDAFTAPGPRNNGLDATTTDPGVGAVTGLARDDGRFKVPSLRNVGLRSPYMHDGASRRWRRSSSITTPACRTIRTWTLRCVATASPGVSTSPTPKERRWSPS